ncbi:MAG: GNAT family N-acetyltransferase [Nanoarchaeota archaeon]|nr:GNAT family N-acetyltransferase [Nanoarchaeota archaeon]
MIVRKVKMSDLEAVYAVYQDFNADLYKYFGNGYEAMRRHKEPVEKMTKDALLKDMRRRKAMFFVAEEDGDIVGYVSAKIIDYKNAHLDRPKTGLIEDLAVKKEHRGKRVSSKLMQEVYSWFKMNDVKLYELKVIAANPAVEIYKKWGFEIKRYDMMRFA